jgi:Holliday junction resolvase RusA-like endonuclease
VIRIDAWGTPVPKGSMKLVTKGKGGRPLPRPLMVADSSHALERWSIQVAGAALVACMGKPRPLLAEDAPLLVAVEFRLERPASVTVRKRAEPSVKPDLDKLVRATLDPLQGLVFAEDSRIVATLSRKRYALPGEGPGATVHVAELGADGALLELIRTFARSCATSPDVEPIQLTLE